MGVALGGGVAGIPLKMMSGETRHTVLLMEEIQLTSWEIVYPFICRVLYIPGGAGFLPSTVSSQNIPPSHFLQNLPTTCLQLEQFPVSNDLYAFRIFFLQPTPLTAYSIFSPQLFFPVSVTNIFKHTKQPRCRPSEFQTSSKRQLEFVHQVLPAQRFELQHEIVHSSVELRRRKNTQGVGGGMVILEVLVKCG